LNGKSNNKPYPKTLKLEKVKYKKKVKSEIGTRKINHISKRLK
jgi:hypothetical protein